MNWWLGFTPLIAAAIGWLLMSLALTSIFHPYKPKKILGITFQGMIPGMQPLLAATIGRASAALFSIDELQNKIAHPDNVKKIMPRAEEHIDHFLRVKLVKAMPVVGMFVGDKTINNLKALFVAELEMLFPEIMQNYMSGLQQDLNIEKLVAEKIATIEPAIIEKNLLAVMQLPLCKIKLLGALLGFIIGALQLATLLLLQ